MSQKIVQFRSKREREKEVDLIAKYRAIGIAAIAAANQAAPKRQPAPQPRRAVTHHD